MARTTGTIKLIERLADKLGNTGRALLLFAILFAIGISYHTRVMQPQLDALAEQNAQCEDDLKECFMRFLDNLEGHQPSTQVPTDDKDTARRL